MLLKEAEVRFGSASRKIRFKVRARENPAPETRADGTAGATVYYAREARHDPSRLRFQLAHEVVHCLSGTFKRDPLKLEEGFAVYFSLNLWANDPAYQEKARDSLPLFIEKPLSSSPV
jgi:hypothetical protein